MPFKVSLPEVLTFCRSTYEIGFLGLVFSDIAASNTKTLVETLMQNRLLDFPLFGIYYGKELANTGNVTEGVLTLGGSKEEQHVDGNLRWIKLRQEVAFQVWRTHWKSVSGGHASANQTRIPVSDGRAVFDTGVGGILVPPELIDDLYTSIGMNYTAIINGDHLSLCSEFNDSWSVSFDFGDWDSYDDRYTVTVTGDELANPGFANSQENCFPPFESSEAFGYGLIGANLIQQRYTVWDFGRFDVENYQPRIGFGKLKEEYRPKATGA